METFGILMFARRKLEMKQWLGWLGTALLLMPILSSNVWAETALSAMDALTPAEQYRQLNLVVMVSAGMVPEFLEYLQAELPDASREATDQEAIPLLSIDDFQTPLNRIVNPGAMIADSARLIRITQQHDAAIMQRMSEVAQSHPDEVAAVDLIQLAEDAIIIRTSLAGSMGYASADAGPAIGGHLETYEDETVHLRNVMEFWKFDQELAAITDDAMQDTGGRMDAYQRMLDEGPVADGFQYHLNAIEMIYKQTRKKSKIKPPDTVNDALIEEQSKVRN